MSEDWQEEERVPLASYFASPGRASEGEMLALAQQLCDDPLLDLVFKTVGGYLMLLNRHRQIIAANDSLYRMLGVERGQSVLGMRYGEALQCVNAARGPNGCGTSVQCRHCGVALAVLAAQAEHQPVDGECSLTCHRGEALQLRDFKLHINPLTLGSEEILAIVFHDITSQKWRELHERMFVHDLSNMLTGLRGWSEELSHESLGEAAPQVVELASRLSEQVAAHRLLMQCEAGTVQLTPKEVDFDGLVTALHAIFGTADVTQTRRLHIENRAERHSLNCDEQILLRVLGNLVKNACEACPIGAIVSVTIETVGHSSLFRIHNPGAISRDVAARLFSPLFSTKGPGRGLGMYSVQILGEHWMGGQVSWDSDEAHGTTFVYALPNG